MAEPGRSPELVAIGNALVDVFATADDELGLRLGLHASRSVHVDQERFQGILDALDGPVSTAGGGAANVAKLAALLGIRAAFVGAVGTMADGESDPFARLFEDELAEAGVQAHLTRGRQPTGACAIIRMPGGELAVAACPGAALELSAEDIDEGLIRRSRVAVLDGFILNRKEIVSHVLTRAERHGTVIALDVASRSIAAEKASQIVGYARNFPLILFMNEDEANAFCRTLTEEDKFTYGDDVEGRSPLLRLTANDLFPIIVEKQGPKGAAVYAGGETHRVKTASTLPFDVTGAGDAFAAGFLAAWIRGKNLGRCAVVGNRLARETLRGPGTRIDRDRLRRLDHLLN